MFCPLIGIDEDAGSGNATGLVAFLLEKNGLLPANTSFVSHQGGELGRECVIHVTLQGQTSALVSGFAHVVFQGSLDEANFERRK